MAESIPFLYPDAETEKGRDNGTFRRTHLRECDEQRRCFCSFWKGLALLSLLTLVLFSLITIHTVKASSLRNLTQSGSLIDPDIDRRLPVPYRWISEYASRTAAGMDEVDRNWDAIKPVHGIVAVDHKWAAEKGLPPSTSLGSDEGKGVYTIAAYHSLHCLTIIRRTLFQLARGETLDVPFGHSTHCLEALRQDVVCTADDTLWYHGNDVAAGDGQVRQCKNWAALRDWAGQHSACFVDNKMAISHEDDKHCDHSDGDGIILHEQDSRRGDAMEGVEAVG